MCMDSDNLLFVNIVSWGVILLMNRSFQFVPPIIIQCATPRNYVKPSVTKLPNPLPRGDDHPYGKKSYPGVSLPRGSLHRGEESTPG